MKSVKIFFNTFYILPFFLIINKGIAATIVILMLIYMTLKLSKLKEQFFNFLEKTVSIFILYYY